MPVFEIQGPDGKTYEIDAPDQNAALSAFQQFSQPSEAQATADKIEAARNPGFFSDLTDSVLQGIPFGDEIIAGAQAPLNATISAIQGEGFDLGREYNETRELQQELRRRREERSPVASVAGSVAGGMALAGPAAKAGLSLLQGAKPTLASLAARGAGEGAIYGGLYGAGEGEGLRERAINAGMGAAAGGLVGGATGALGRIGASRVDTKGLPNAEDLNRAAQSAYQRADQAGVIYSPQATQRIRDRLAGEFAEFGYHPELQPGARAALGEMERLAGRNTTLKGLDTARKIAGNAYQQGNKANNALAAKVRDAIDEVIENPQAGDVLTGAGGNAGAALGEARSLYSRARKLELVQELMRKAGLDTAASGSGGNIENATRRELRRLITNPKFRRSFNKEELAAIEKAVTGSKPQNLLRLLGKLSPGGNGLMTALGLGSAGTGLAVGGLEAAIPSIALMGVGAGSKAAANSMAANNARLVEALIASGGNLPAPSVSAIRKALLEGLTRSGGQQLPAYTSQ